MFLFYIRLTGVLMIIAGVFLGWVLFRPGLEEKISALPDYNYIPEIRKLIVQEKYGEAGVLCEDVISCNLPGKEEAKLLRDLCDEQKNAVHLRIWRACRAFVTGNSGNSIEEAGGAIVSDMMMYGDLRDLILQGYFRITGKETDWFIVALSSAGLLTEAIDAVDWCPALLKALRKVGSVSEPLAKDIIQAAKKSSTAVPLLKNIRIVFGKSGFVRTGRICRSLNTVGDLGNAAKLVSVSPEAAHLVIRSAGKQASQTAEMLARGNVSGKFLKRLACKGPGGVTLYLRAGKSFRKGNVMRFVDFAAAELRKFSGAGRWMIPAALILAGGLMNFRRLRFRKPPAEKSI